MGLMTRLAGASRITALATGAFLALSLIAVDHAEARKGGSFGSRGTRTFQSAPPTRTAPQPVAPVERSMTPQQRTAPGTSAQQTQSINRPGGLFGAGFGGSMLRGLALGGLIGLLLGHGFGGMAGLFGFLIQGLLLAGLVMLALRFFRSRSEPAMAGAAYRNAGSAPPEPFGSRQAGGFRIPSVGSGETVRSTMPDGPVIRDLQLTQSDLEAFERALTELQTAFGREDHTALRRIATPEMVSYLSEELAENARAGQRNDVSAVRLLQADVAESWSEDATDYATAAMLYEARDVMVDRASGRLVSGAAEPAETTELWTFTRPRGGDWKVSAIQEVAASA